MSQGIIHLDVFTAGDSYEIHGPIRPETPVSSDQFSEQGQTFMPTPYIKHQIRFRTVCESAGTITCFYDRTNLALYVHKGERPGVVTPGNDLLIRIRHLWT